MHFKEYVNEYAHDEDNPVKNFKVDIDFEREDNEEGEDFLDFMLVSIIEDHVRKIKYRINLNKLVELEIAERVQYRIR